jgi:hypothetical protein
VIYDYHVVLGATAALLGIVALESLSLTAALFPVVLVTGNVLLVTVILLRRRQLARLASNI